jgi:hypothetical protein
MKSIKAALILGAIALLAGIPAAAQMPSQLQCTGSQDAAVQCFVTNAVSTRLASIPSGMTLAQYQAYGVAVSKTFQTPTLLVFLIGMTSAVADALPPTNAQGNSDQSAQETAVNAVVAAGLKDKLFALPSEVSLTQLQQIAREMTGQVAQNSGLVISPGALLRTLDSYIVSATSASSGAAAAAVNWLEVTTGLSTLVDNLMSTGLMKLPTGITSSDVKQFALDVCTAIEQYKQATQKAHL